MIFYNAPLQIVDYFTASSLDDFLEHCRIVIAVGKLRVVEFKSHSARREGCENFRDFLQIEFLPVHHASDSAEKSHADSRLQALVSSAIFVIDKNNALDGIKVVEEELNLLLGNLEIFRKHFRLGEVADAARNDKRNICSFFESPNHYFPSCLQ